MKCCTAQLKPSRQALYLAFPSCFVLDFTAWLFSFCRFWTYLFYVKKKATKNTLFSPMDHTGP